MDGNGRLGTEPQEPRQLRSVTNMKIKNLAFFALSWMPFIYWLLMPR